ncbi:hypothetical protein HWB57_gp043 [Erwinia phage vB_EamM-Bue1]|uniref:Uncharacterized protein n=1 Tax=Erwinia phage vB_EamM-Bue1 TaxID=2099338 RepID=A0A2P1JU77_9CAUD|nr:hypothetical protein HWB57_gp043 [Erwinia phage vB_EamM-Bue1]AVO22883.1 hypothetical protein [Erwinia phage vB_EamM-Bue1]
MRRKIAKLLCILKGDYSSPDVVPKYELIDAGEDQLSIFHITEGLYKGTQYRVGRVAFVPEGDDFKLSFVTDIIKHPYWGKIKDSDQEFDQISGNILRVMMSSNAGDYGKFLVM